MAKPLKNRECGPCTECCEGWLNMDINGTHIHAGHPCPNLSAKGCSTYEDRPEVCRGYACSWLKNDLDLPEWLRPDNSRVIVQQLPRVAVITAIPGGKKVPPRALNHLKKLADTRRSALVYYGRSKENGKFSTEMKASSYAPPGCQSELEKLQKIVKHMDKSKP